MRSPAGSGAEGHDGEPGQERSGSFVSVAVRVKPAAPDSTLVLWPKEPEGPGHTKRVCCDRGYVLEEYEFSRVFGPEDSNCRLFEDLQGQAISGSVFDGVNETLFAYGQTGSGKTHTIFGTREELGLLQYFVQEIFARVDRLGSTVHLCCYEVLGDTLTDLMDVEPMLERGVLCDGDVVQDELFLKTQKYRYHIVRVGTQSTCLSLLQAARVNRASGMSSCNSASSRSHAIVHLFVQSPIQAGKSRADGGSPTSTIGALTLVDLAGAEKEHENPSEQGRKTARLLNTSLSSLNRLLRKLQTSSLNESERRQSVLNKCLWDYLRPGCGIALIFCVSPTLKHREVTVSTLAMATDSKSIRSRRKARYIQAPIPQQSARTRSSSQPMPSLPSQAFMPPQRSSTPTGGGRRNPQIPAVWPAGSAPMSSMGSSTRGATSDLASTPREELGSTPRGGGELRSMDRTSTVSSPRSASTDLDSDAAIGRPPCSSLPTGPQTDELERLCGHDLRTPLAVCSLALQNSELRKKLGRTRSKSQERVMKSKNEMSQLNADNKFLRDECESLRSLFIRQQQQQIAFWTGPFMDMAVQRDGVSSELVKSPNRSDITPAGLDALDASALPGPVPGAMPGMMPGLLPGVMAASMPAQTLEASRPLVQMPSTRAAEIAKEDCFRSLRKERDYWRSVAAELRQELDVSSRPGSAGSRGTRLSTPQHESEVSRAPWSDSGSVLTPRGDSGSEQSVKR